MMKRVSSAIRSHLVILRVVLSIAAIVTAIAGLTATLTGCSHPADAATSPQIVFFYMEDCYKCDRMKEVLEELLESHPGLSVKYYEWYGNTTLLRKLATRYGLGNTLSVPTIFVGARAISGDGRARELLLREAIEVCVENGCRSPLR